ncbi:MAG: superoxide dismutase, Ni, partial [Actinomycetota bacterium]|nr:superoxide dismutase, Ni [Actinomycetota bacterium]
MTVLSRLIGLADHFGAPSVAHAHCDLPCGVYDPAQARIEADSVKAIMEKFNASDDSTFKTRAVTIK